MFGEVTVMFYFVVHHVGALARTYCSCSAFDHCFLQSYQESYEAGKELAHGDVITVTYELDAEDECEITMYLGVSVPHTRMFHYSTTIFGDTRSISPPSHPNIAASDS